MGNRAVGQISARWLRIFHRGAVQSASFSALCGVFASLVIGSAGCSKPKEKERVEEKAPPPQVRCVARPSTGSDWLRSSEVPGCLDREWVCTNLTWKWYIEQLAKSESAGTMGMQIRDGDLGLAMAIIDTYSKLVRASGCSDEQASRLGAKRGWTVGGPVDEPPENSRSSKKTKVK